MAEIGNTTSTPDQKLPHGAVTKAIINWSNGMLVTPFIGADGPDAASMLLLKANAIIQCLAAAHGSADEFTECEFALLSEKHKSMALEGVGDLIQFAKMLVDDH